MYPGERGMKDPLPDDSPTDRWCGPSYIFLKINPFKEKSMTFHPNK